MKFYGTAPVPVGFDDLPPSAKYIHKVLTYEGPLQYSEIVDRTALAQSTVNNALALLREFDDVRCVPGTDARLRYYNVERER